jgi:hypothetical protein
MNGRQERTLFGLALEEAIYLGCGNDDPTTVPDSANFSLTNKFAHAINPSENCSRKFRWAEDFSQDFHDDAPNAFHSRPVRLEADCFGLNRCDQAAFGAQVV